MIVTSPWASLQPHARGVTVTKYLEHATARFGDKAAFIDASGRPFTFSEIQQASRRLGRFLQDRGYAPGERIAILSANTPAYAIAFLGIAYAGCVAAPVNPLYREREVLHQLDDCGVVAVFVMRFFENTARSAVAELPLVRDVWAIEDVWQIGNESPPDPLPVDAGPSGDRLVSLPYSSGTTGLPKGVMISHANLIANTRQAISTGLAGEHSVFLDFLPFFHAYGLTVLMHGGLASGATQVLVPHFDARQCLELIARHGVTSLFVVPPALLALTALKEEGSFDTSSIEYIMSGAAPLSLELSRRAQAAFEVPILEGYGMTETSAAANVTPLDSPRAGSVGPPLPDTEEKIVSLDDDRELEAHEEGELCIRGPQVMRGYWQRPAETAATFTSDGWLRTGDIARFDDDGFLYLVDRKKELIKYKGFQVAPAELEALLVEHPGVLDAAVVARPDARAGQVPKAFVVANPTGCPAADEILRFVADRVASYKRLRDIEFIDAIPRSLTGKILRRELIERDRAKNG